MRKSSLTIGFACLAASAALYLVTRELSVAMWEERVELEISASLSIGIALCLFSIIVAVAGTGLLFARRPTRLTLAGAHVLLAGLTLAGMVLTLWDYLSASGFNNIGAGMMMLAGNTMLPIAACLSVGTGLVKAGLLIRPPTASAHQPGS